MPPDPQPEAMVPVWALNLTASVAEIKAKTDALPNIEKELEGLRATMVPMSEHQRLLMRVDTLWDAYNAALGKVESRQRSEKLWRYGLSLAIAVLGTWIALHQANVHVGF